MWNIERVAIDNQQTLQIVEIVQYVILWRNTSKREKK